MRSHSQAASYALRLAAPATAPHPPQQLLHEPQDQTWSTAAVREEEDNTDDAFLAYIVELRRLNAESIAHPHSQPLSLDQRIADLRNYYRLNSDRDHCHGESNVDIMRVTEIPEKKQHQKKKTSQPGEHRQHRTTFPLSPPLPSKQPIDAAKRRERHAQQALSCTALARPHSRTSPTPDPSPPPPPFVASPVPKQCLEPRLARLHQQAQARRDAVRARIRDNLQQDAQPFRFEYSSTLRQRRQEQTEQPPPAQPAEPKRIRPSSCRLTRQAAEDGRRRFQKRIESEARAFLTDEHTFHPTIHYASAAPELEPEEDRPPAKTTSPVAFKGLSYHQESFTARCTARSLRTKQKQQTEQSVRPPLPAPAAALSSAPSVRSTKSTRLKAEARQLSHEIADLLQHELQHLSRDRKQRLRAISERVVSVLQDQCRQVSLDVRDEQREHSHRHQLREKVKRHDQAVKEMHQRLAQRPLLCERVGTRTS
ncbi:hypothetical protein RI367_001012 [Sorochytrium milnesiophthora]